MNVDAIQFPDVAINQRAQDCVPDVANDKYPKSDGTAEKDLSTWDSLAVSYTPGRKRPVISMKWIEMRRLVNARSLPV